MSSPDPRANPLALGPLQTRDDVARAVIDLYEPLLPHVSPGGARVRLGSFASVFEQSTAELEGFARPLYGIVPLTVGGYDFAHWDRFGSGLDAGTDPDSEEYWGPVPGDNDQRMVEQAAIGLALAFCPEQTWERLSSPARDRLVTWLHGVFEHDPNPNNWQFFRVLVALGLERVGAPFDAAKLTASLDLVESYRVGRHWYADGSARDRRLLRAVRIPHLRADVRRGQRSRSRRRLSGGCLPRACERVRRRHPALVRTGRRSGTVRAQPHVPVRHGVVLGCAGVGRCRQRAVVGCCSRDVDASPSLVGRSSDQRPRWGAVDRLHVRRTGALSETYSSAGSPYWCMKAFGALAAPADHPFWTSDETPLDPLPAPVTIRDAGQVIARDREHAVILNGRPAVDLDFPEQAAAKYRKFAYSSVFGFSGDVADMFGAVQTDSMLALTDVDGNRRVRLSVEAAGVEDAMTWSTWRPWPDVRVDSVCWAIDASCHGRIHRIRTGRDLVGVESGFAIGLDGPRDLLGDGNRTGGDRSVIETGSGVSAIVDLAIGDTRLGLAARRPIARNLAVNASLVHPRTAVPALTAPLPTGDHTIACLVVASPRTGAMPPAGDDLVVPAAAVGLLERRTTQEVRP